MALDGSGSAGWGVLVDSFVGVHDAGVPAAAGTPAPRRPSGRDARRRDVVVLLVDRDHGLVLVIGEAAGEGNLPVVGVPSDVEALADQDRLDVVEDEGAAEDRVSL